MSLTSTTCECTKRHDRSGSKCDNAVTVMCSYVGDGETVVLSDETIGVCDDCQQRCLDGFVVIERLVNYCQTSTCQQEGRVIAQVFAHGQWYCNSCVDYGKRHVGECWDGTEPCEFADCSYCHPSIGSDTYPNVTIENL